MRRSFVRLVVSSVLVCWAAGFVVLFLYSRTLTWTEQRARRAGIFLAYELLDKTPPARRSARLRDIAKHFSVKLALVAPAEVARRVGRATRPGVRVAHHASARAHWYFIVFADGQAALAAGPKDPAMPAHGFIPIGVIIAILGLPVIAGLVAVRVERRLRRVELASQALAAGELSARVDDEHGSSELATRFNAMAERVERLVRSRDELVQAVSHELGSPLSRLRFHIELLDNPPDEQQRQQRLDAMTRELDALDELVAELLSYVQSDELEIDRQSFDPQRGLADLVELASLEAPEERGVEVRLALVDDVRVFADERLFHRAIENILRNAVRHASGTVLLELAQDDEHVHVVVHDDGPGVPEALRGEVIGPFVRLDADRDRKTGGVGLGLAIVDRVMQRHGGRLEIGDAPLGGAMVATLWPRPQQETEKT